jgi:hypothetical protein
MLEVAITMSEVVRRVLWLGIEDYSGLWEVVWELNTLRDDKTPAENRATAQEIVTELLEKDLIQIFQCEEPDGSPVAVPMGVAKKILETDSAWEPPGFNGVSWRIGATDKGERAYNK